MLYTRLYQIYVFETLLEPEKKELMKIQGVYPPPEVTTFWDYKRRFLSRHPSKPSHSWRILNHLRHLAYRCSRPSSRDNRRIRNSSNSRPCWWSRGPLDAEPRLVPRFSLVCPPLQRALRVAYGNWRRLSHLVGRHY